MEFKGKQRAEEYASEKSSSPVFKENHIKDYLSGYNQALEDSKSNEMLEMLQWFVENFEGVFHKGTETDNKVNEAQQLVKQATEL
mgnify:CR=1 FL=1